MVAAIDVNQPQSCLSRFGIGQGKRECSAVGIDRDADAGGPRGRLGCSR
jgi:hypothetical protein